MELMKQIIVIDTRFLGYMKTYMRYLYIIYTIKISDSLLMAPDNYLHIIENINLTQNLDFIIQMRLVSRFSSTITVI